MHVVKRDRVFQILGLLGESICQAREPAHSHSHCEILAFNVARRDVVKVRPLRPSRSHADSRAVAHLRAFWRSPANLLKLRVVNLCSENLIDRKQVSAVSVRCQLNAMRQTLLQVRKKMVGASNVARVKKRESNFFGLLDRLLAAWLA
jgi:hypothetical protein